MPKISLIKKPRVTPSIKFLKEELKDKEPLELDYDSAPEGLVPIGDTGLYITPDEPADPRDCDRYPDSIYCGSIPWTWTPVGLEPTIVIDECNVGITLTPILGWTILPIISFVYRKPECRVENRKKDTPIPNPGADYNIHLEFPANSCNSKENSIIIEYAYYFSRYSISRYAGEDLVYNFKEYNVEIVDVQFPYVGEHRVTHPTNSFIQDYINPKYPVIADVKPIAAITFNYPVRNDNYLYNWTEEALNGIPLAMQEGGYGLIGSPVTDVLYVLPFGGTSFTFVIDKFAQMGNGNVSANQKYIQSGGTIDSVSSRRTFNVNGDIDNRNGYYYLQQETVNRTIQIVCYGTLPLPPEKCCMQCCPPPDDSLLRLLIKKVDTLSKIVGVDDYPVSLPTSLISKDEGFLGNLIPNENVDVPSLTKLAAWYIERFDEIMGQWEIPIEIKDSDPTKPGEQPVGIKLPNVAECLAEMFTLCFQTNINSETLLNMNMRILAETGGDKQQNFVTYKLLQSLTDWVGYKQKDTKQKMPLTFTPGKTRYDEILKECEVDVSAPEFDEKFGLEADLMRFREAAAILQANHKIKIDPNGDIKAQILKYLLNTFKNIKKVNGEDSEQEFEDFLEQVEQGFINTRGIKDNINPYGRPFAERPRIRDLTNFESDTPNA